MARSPLLRALAAFARRRKRRAAEDVVGLCAAALLLASPAAAQVKSVPLAPEGAPAFPVGPSLQPFQLPAPLELPAAVETLPVLPPLLSAPERAGGVELLEELGQAARKGHRPRAYDEAKHELFTKAESVERDGVRGVVDAYSGTFVPGRGAHGGAYPERGDANHDGRVDGMNTEHLWPQYFFESLEPEARAVMRADLHHLLATFAGPNEVRGHLPFGEVTNNDYPNSGGAKRGDGVFEPPDAVKGRVARAMLYMFARYRKEGILPKRHVESFWNSHVETLLKWNREHPPTAEEVRRNDIVQEFQGNRNPFIDASWLADRVGLAGFRLSREDRRAIGNRRHRQKDRRRERFHWNPDAEDESPAFEKFRRR